MATYYVMRSPGFSGPYRLNADKVDALVPEGPGVYVLSEKTAKGEFLACYVGRADASLARRLQQHVGNYSYFYFKECDTENGAFFSECHLFHTYGKANFLDNEIHPAIPKGSGLPKCAETGCRGEAY